MTGAGLGALMGWLLARPWDQRLGLSIGGGVGALIGGAWKMWRQRRCGLSDASPSLGWGYHAVYALAIVLCLYMIGLAFRHWVQNPDQWLTAVAGLLFFGTGIIVFVVLWKVDRKPESNQGIKTQYNVAFGICGFILLLSSLLVGVLGHPVIALMGSLFFGLCSIMAFRRV